MGVYVVADFGVGVLVSFGAVVAVVLDVLADADVVCLGFSLKASLFLIVC
jgi:hypothetical protein